MTITPINTIFISFKKVCHYTDTRSYMYMFSQMYIFRMNGVEEHSFTNKSAVILSISPTLLTYILIVPSWATLQVQKNVSSKYLYIHKFQFSKNSI